VAFRWLLGLAGLLAAGLVVGGLVGTSGPRRNDPAPAADPLPVLPVSTSPFLNTAADARYVGSEACRSCHAGRTSSFRRTGMGRSLAEVDLAREPPDGDFDHPLSKRRYQVRRKDGQLWHRELLLDGGPDEVVLAEYPLKYVVGSGRHSLTYLVEADGFLVESPLTWYTAKNAWCMSPGYDRPEHAGFERAVGEGCLICHAGHAEAVGGSLHRMRLPEPAIGCERCHGPGALHVERHARRERPLVPTPLPRGERGRDEGPAAGIDYTIVNPTHLSRDLAEEVCQQCHLRAAATVVARGRKLDDYRPGLPLQDFRADYRLAVPDSSMTVVGHVEQMHLSRCYQGSKTLSCLTCHNPHSEPRPEARVAHYKAICLNCHTPERCTVPPPRRQKESPDNNCVHCHMPTAPTEIPHLAFTHHRIGVHAGPAAPPSPLPLSPAGRGVGVRGRAGEGHGPGVLEPFLDLSRFGEADRQRSLGMGYLEVASRARAEGLRLHYQEQALKVLSQAQAAGLREPVLDLALGRARFALGLEGVLPYAERALAHADLSGQDRCDALFLVADAQAAERRHEDAAATLRELNGLRRHAVQWLLLADCERALGRPDAAVAALEGAVRINPRLGKAHQYLADHYRRQGDPKRAAWHQRRAAP
jgi:predicted CXXCH cytochrome family protein